MSVGRWIAAPLLAVLLTAMLASSAAAYRGRVFGTPFGGVGSGAGQLSLTYFYESRAGTVGGSGVAVDESTHDLYVADTNNNRVDEFSATGTFIRAWGWGVVNGAEELQVCTTATGCRAGLAGAGAGELESPAFVAVDNYAGGEGDVYVSNFYDRFGGENLVQKFTPEGALVESWGDEGALNEDSLPAPEELSSARGIAVLPTGRLLVSDGPFFEFDGSTGAFTAKLKTTPEGVEIGDSNGLAVDGAGNLYFAGGQETIYKLNSEGVEQGSPFHLLAIPPPKRYDISKGVAASKTGELYVDEGQAVQVVAASCDSDCVPALTLTSPDLSEGGGLGIDSSTQALYIADVAHDWIVPSVLEPPAAPEIEAGSQTVSDVSGNSATLEAVINPRSEAGEEDTAYHFQYTTDERFAREGFAGASTAPVPDGQLTPSFEADPVSAHVQGLLPGTLYRYRVVAENAVSRREGAPAEGEEALGGEEVARTFETQYTGAGGMLDDRAWELVSPADKFGALLEINPGTALVQAAGDGEAFTYVASASTESNASGNNQTTQVMSVREAASGGWTSRDISTPRTVAGGLKDGPSEFRHFSSDLSSAVINPFGAFDPLLSDEASEQTAYLRTNFISGDPTDPCLSSCYRPLVTATPGFANVPEGTVLDAGDCREAECGPTFVGATPDDSHVLLTSRAPLIEGAPAEGLYQWTAGQLQLVSVLPNGEPAPQGGLPGGRYNGIGLNNGVARHEISTDGSRVVWSSAGESLYLRDMHSEETVLVGDGLFQDASEDGSRVFFTHAGDLYCFEAPLGEPLSSGHLVNLTPGGGVRQNIILGVSSDGSYVYFVAETALGEGEANQQGERPVAKQPNLYVEHEGTVRLVAVLSYDDGRDWSGEGTEGNGLLKFDNVTAQVSEDGHWLAFMSDRSLTGYDNRDAASGARDEEVFLYDATADGGRGAVTCASCDPTGARPHGVLFSEAGDHKVLVDAAEAWDDRWVAANVPGWQSPEYQPRYLRDSGRLFFDSSDALVPSDTNGTEDVYEFEPPGVGTCTTAQASFSPLSGGCVGLVSAGTSTEESAFLDASESGDDVFFMTSAQLVSADKDSVDDVYDARVDGGFPAAQPVPACEGDACQSPGRAPSDATPGSLTFHGPGNSTPPGKAGGKPSKKKRARCHAGRKKKRGRCVKRKAGTKSRAKKGRQQAGKARAGHGERREA